MAGPSRFAQGRNEVRAELRWVRFRMWALGGLLLAALAALLGRAAQLQVTQGQQLTRLAREQYLLKVAIPGKRGSITDRSGTVLAASAPVESVYADLSQLDDPRALRSLAEVLHLGPHELESLSHRLDLAAQFAWIKRQIAPSEGEAVRRLQAGGIVGIGMVKESRRFYPERELAAQLLGVVSVDGEGLEGLEHRFDEELKGRSAQLTGIRDAHGHSMGGDPVNAPELAGAEVRLTLDRNLQYLCEQELQKGMASTHAQAGVAAILEPGTGAILALAVAPSFNPNAVGERDREAMRDRAVTDAFEPGSTFKAFLVAAALEDKVVNKDTVLFAENGSYTLNGRTIHDHTSYGWLTVPQVLQVSSNIGAAKIGLLLGRERLAHYLRDFGFGQRTEVELPGEVRGQLPPLRSDLSTATASFGQGVTATPMQLLQGYLAIASGGRLLRPYLVSRITQSDGTVQRFEPTELRQPIHAETARALTAMLEKVVQRGGTAKDGAVEGFRVAGKTGTAQKVDPLTGSYSADKRFSSFVGYLPAEAPRAVIGVFLDEPKGEVYGGKIAAPIFREIAAATMRELGVAPDPALAAVAVEGEHSKSVPRGVRASAAASPAALSDPSAASSEASEDDDAPEQPAPAGGVPKVLGLSLRGALGQLRAAGLAAVPNGSGRVVAQRPRSGQPMPQNRTVALTLANAAGERGGGL